MALATVMYTLVHESGDGRAVPDKYYGAARTAVSHFVSITGGPETGRVMARNHNNEEEEVPSNKVTFVGNVSDRVKPQDIVDRVRSEVGKDGKGFTAYPIDCMFAGE